MFHHQGRCQRRVGKQFGRFSRLGWACLFGVMSPLVVNLLAPVVAGPGWGAAWGQSAAAERGAQDATPEEPKANPDFDEFLSPLEHSSGFLDVYRDAEKGLVYLRLPAPSDPASGEIGRCLYIESLRSGLGSNPIGLDRGQLGESRVLVVRRLGPKVLFEIPNLSFRANTENPDERAAVERSFATSVIWGKDAEVVADDGRAVVDITSFLIRDAHGVVATLAAQDEGEFKLDRSRSAVDPTAILSFPKNTEFEAVLTFGGRKPGRNVRGTVPEATSITLVQHHSFVELPDDGYRPRVDHVRSGAIQLGYLDYAVPLDDAMATRYVLRHRLQKKYPDRPMSPPVEKIVYYIDRGAPEPVKTALVEGAWWWLRAFQAAGFEDAYAVEILPEDAHPLDVRYNVVQWVHRSTRGWSYGGSVIDPRTGEIIKGHVSLGSLRVRQDRRIFEGLWGTATTGSGEANDPIQVSLARLRQLSAHEIGHTLGLAHNFAASSYGRASVMDYPAPMLRVVDGVIDASEAYDVGIGDWDTHAMRYLYTEFANEEEELEGLKAIVREGVEAGYVYLTDADARPSGASDARGSLWDNGEDPVSELEAVGEVRALAIEQFGEDRVRAGRPLTELREAFVPVYLYHRYQVEAAIKLVGGIRYEHRLGGEAGIATELEADDRQRAALDAVVATLEPGYLEIPESTRRLLVPRSPGYPRGRELFPSQTEPHFDPMTAATVAVELVVDLLLDESRAARLVEARLASRDALGFGDVVDRLLKVSSDTGNESDAQRALRVVVLRAVVEELFAHVNRSRSSPVVRAIALSRLAKLRRTRFSQVGTPADHARALIAFEIDAFFEGRPRPEGRVTPRRQSPPGSPIGSGHRSFWQRRLHSQDGCSHCPRRP